MDLALVPRQDDRPGEAGKNSSQERGHMHGLEVVLLEAGTQADVPVDLADGDGVQRRNAVILAAVGHNRRSAFRTPGSTSRWNEQKAALIQEGQMGPKASSLFFI